MAAINTVTAHLRPGARRGKQCNGDGEDYAFRRLDRISRADAETLGRLALQLSPSARFDAGALRRSIRQGSTNVFVLRLGGRIAASATAVQFSTPTGAHCRIEDVVVDERMRGRGLGRTVMRKTLDTLRAMKVAHVELTSRPSRVAAKALYRSLGFSPRDTGVFELHLSAPAADGGAAAPRRATSRSTKPRFMV